MELNREELIECMSCVQQKKNLQRMKKKIEKVFEHIKCLVSPEVDMLMAQLERIANKIKSINVE